MSSPLFKSDILYTQRLLASCGMYKGALDGIYGPKTQAAEDAFDAYSRTSAAKYGTFDARTEGVIVTLLPKAQDAARMFMNAAKQFPATVKLLSGTRTYAEQNDLYAKGRTTKGPVVTNARGGYSWHNFGIAFDVGIFNNGVYNTGSTAKGDAQYSELARLIKTKLPNLLEWGGSWTSFPDKPHYQLPTGKSVSQARSLLEQGKVYA